MFAYYNDVDPFCVEWLRMLIKRGLIPDGYVDDRSIRDVRPEDIREFGQCHFFAGLGGFAYAARLAGWPDHKVLWTGGFPCQPFSVSGRRLADKDDRHLWPELHRLIAQARPPVFLGENVAGIVGLALDGVLFDLESIRYASRAFIVPACAVNTPHRRDRVWIIAKPVGDSEIERFPVGESLPGDVGQEFSPSVRTGGVVDVADAARLGRSDERLRDGSAGQHVGAQLGAGGGDIIRGRATRSRPVAARDARETGFWDSAEWIIGRDGKARRVKSGIRLLVNGISGRVAVRRSEEQSETSDDEHWYNRIGTLRAFGNAIVPQVAAEFIKAIAKSEE